MNAEKSDDVKKKRFPVIVVTVVIAFVCVISTSVIWFLFHRAKVAAMAHEQRVLEQRIFDLEWEGAKLYESMEYADQSDSTRDELNRLRAMMEATDSRVKGKLLKIYEYNSLYDRPGIGFYVATDENATLYEKVALIADILSRVYFRDHPIDLLRIADRDGKKIAVVDLREPESEGVFSWRSGFFQGSSGGYWTTYMLVNAFLQQDYKGEWVDGVVFYYQGKPIIEEWDHIFLHGAKLRKVENR